jgi:protein ImuB
VAGLRSCWVECDDWAAVAAMRRDQQLTGTPFVVTHRVGPRELVLAASAPARAAGVRTGMRRREAEACCADLIVLGTDPPAEARAFEAVAHAVESFTPRVELGAPGRLVFPTLGPSRYFGGDGALGEMVLARLVEVLGPGPVVRVGIADGCFAARLAAMAAPRTDAHSGFLQVVAAGESGAFVAPFPVQLLGDERLAQLLERLGLPTLGEFAALPAPAVLARFGANGARAHELACGDDPTVLDLGVVPAECIESIELDPPVTRVDAAAFAAKVLADRLVLALGARGMACTRVVIEAETEHGEQLARCWRHEEGFGAAALVERMRWQLDGWLAAQTPRPLDGDARAAQDLQAFAETGLDSTTGALTRLRIVPDEVVPVPARQLGFFGGDAAAAARADRTLSRLQGMLGYDTVGTLIVQGGRSAPEQTGFVPWGEPRTPLRPLVADGYDTPWPGALPPPAPARQFTEPVPAELLDEHERLVRVSGRGEASASPHLLRSRVIAGGCGVVRGWAGPWPTDERWWDPRAHRRVARWQLLVETDAGELACIVAVRGTHATIEAIYD